MNARLKDSKFKSDLRLADVTPVHEKVKDFKKLLYTIKYPT